VKRESDEGYCLRIRAGCALMALGVLSNEAASEKVWGFAKEHTAFRLIHQTTDPDLCHAVKPPPQADGMPEDPPPPSGNVDKRVLRAIEGIRGTDGRPLDKILVKIIIHEEPSCVEDLQFTTPEDFVGMYRDYVKQHNSRLLPPAVDDWEERDRAALQGVDVDLWKRRGKIRARVVDEFTTMPKMSQLTLTASARNIVQQVGDILAEMTSKAIPCDFLPTLAKVEVPGSLDSLIIDADYELVGDFVSKFNTSTLTFVEDGNLLQRLVQNITPGSNFGAVEADDLVTEVLEVMPDASRDQAFSAVVAALICESSSVDPKSKFGFLLLGLAAAVADAGASTQESVQKFLCEKGFDLTN